MRKHPSRALVAMSGGVDSSLSAAVLQEKGWSVHGLHLVLPAEEKVIEQRLARIARIAEHLDIPMVNVDVRDAFHQAVMDPFVKAYSRGFTPNPCVICNEAIKFRYLQEYAERYGIEFLATGHYARIRSGVNNQVELWRGLPGKEQSYFLHRLTQTTLSRTLFPLGSCTKKEAKEKASEMGLPFHSGDESQEICFLANSDYRPFVEEKARLVVETVGQIVDVDGNILGVHGGTHRYTIGQRQGLGVASSRPYYVKELRPKENTVVVARREEISSRGLKAESFHWVGDPISGKVDGVLAQIRYRHTAAPGTLEVLSPGAVRFVFDEPQWAVTPGQALVCYEGERVLGGGWITTTDAVG